MMASAAATMSKFWVAVFLLGLIAAVLAVRADGARLLSSDCTELGMEADDLSLEQQQQVMDMGSKLEAITRKLLTTDDPYHTKY
ncbi:hypothetical protein O6H91_15G064100 [Diphasiastrum complanatum]|uniref:Uncharacterized protein n=2 Tax=Diphasiastrum complanatum TaxID=34168 RepID=A0ACC2BJ07_DIPCM|nr:hypothetical protein O6H91_15G064100 [Diphasiastrum complanatum]